MSVLVLFLYGCGGPSASPPVVDSRPQRPAEQVAMGDAAPPADVVATPIDARPAALVNGRMLDWGELKPSLSEAAGGEVLAEAVLDRLISQELMKANITLSPDALAAERALMLSSLQDDVNQAVRLLQELQERRGLGPARFAMLLRRNAALRALVRDQVKVSDEAIAVMHDRIHGRKRQARLIVVKTLEEAQQAIALVRSGESFAEVAAAVSIDPSAARGGLLEPISLADPAYPRVIREALWLLGLGEVSAPLLLSEQFAILLMVKEIPGGDVSPADSHDAMAKMVRLEQERLLMEQLARRLLASATVAVFDESLKISWDQWKRRGQMPE